MTIADALAAATRQLTPVSETPRLDAELLLAHLLGVDRTHLFVALPDPMPADRETAFADLIARRVTGEPVAYLIGEREFMGLPFAVGPGVLVPRPETELLVERALAWLADRPRATIVDVGAGSGAIALSLAALLHADRANRIIAVEPSPEAMPWLERNRRDLGLTERVEIRGGDLLSAIEPPVDLLLANLPYLTPEQVASSPSIQAEPREALLGGADGLDLVRRLLADAPRVLRSPAAIGLELDPSQIAEASRIARRHLPDCAVEVIDDLAGHHRHLWITIPGYHHDVVRQRIATGAETMTQAGKDPRLVPYGGGNFGMPLELTDELIVPTPLFFTRSNGPVPEIDAETWRLEVRGEVETPLSLSLSDLRGIGEITITAFLECAGNGRTRFEPIPEGTPWINDAAGNATWTGIPLAWVLARAGVRPTAVDVVAQGADFADMQRGLPLANALDPATMLVWGMNGEPLTVPHGAPVRLLVPRWAGIASTKWLASLTVTAEPFTGYYNANNYVLISPAGEHLAPVREMPVKSLIQHPLAGATLPSGRHRITGYAWSGYGGIIRVEVSTDGGGHWQDAELIASAGPLSWTRWAFDWDAVPGEGRIQARATDQRTMTQPVEATWNMKGYQMNGIHEVAVTVTGS